MNLLGKDDLCNMIQRRATVSILESLSFFPVVGIIGAKEVEDKTISVRTRIGGELGAIGVDEVVQRVVDSIADFSDF